MSNEEIVWRPTGYYATESRVAQFMNEYDIDSYDELIPESSEELARFWDRAVTDLGLVWEEEYTEVLDTSDGVPFAKWFSDGRLNATRTMLDRWVETAPERTAYVHESESGGSTEITYRELAARTNRATNALRAAGIGEGDTVGIIGSLHPSAIVMSLAALRVGALQTQIFAGYGTTAIQDRLADCEVDLVFFTDGYRREGATLDLVTKVDDALDGVPSVERVVRYENVGIDSEVTATDCTAWETFLAEQSTEAEPAIVDAEHPALVAYSSGTTGKPKGTIHTHASLLANGMKEAAYQFDLGSGDTMFWVTDFGWVVVPAWLIAGSQALGATTVLMEGSPTAPSKERVWELVERHGVTTLGMSPTGARQLERINPEPRADYDLSELRVLGSTGEPWDESTWRWYFDAVGDGEMPIINDSGGTEACGGLLAPTPKTPLKPCTLWGPAPGIPADVFDADGEPADHGYLVVDGPFVGMSRSLTDGDERYLEAYWDRFGDAWNQNDWVSIDQDGFWFIRGRADDTMNISGRRITAPTLEDSITAVDEVTEAAVVPVDDPTRGQVPVGFVTTDTTVSADALESAVNSRIKEHLGAPFQLDELHVVSGLPRTQTGKLPRNVIESRYAGDDDIDTSTLDGGEILQEFPERTD
jgi:acetyl-CoA synthetase